jgi:hypothetical protein
MSIPTTFRLFYVLTSEQIGQRLQCRDKYFFKIKFVFFLYLWLSSSSKESDLPLCIYFWYQTDSGVPNTSIYAAVSLASPYYCLRNCRISKRKQYNTVVSNHVNSDHVPSFSCLDVWTNRKVTSVFTLLLWQRRYQLNYFICIKDFNEETKYFIKIKLVFFLYLRLSASSKENDLPLCIYFWYQTDSWVPNTSIAITVTTSAYHSRRCGRL